MKKKMIDCEYLVIGSGPGGATTAFLLAEAGADVVLVEEGPELSLDDVASYSLAEMNQKYRNGGMTLSFGSSKIVYIEPCCVGGASEINAGLYHYPLSEKLAEWQRENDIDNFSEESLRPFFESSEQDVPVAYYPKELGPASRKLQQGAEELQWQGAEVPRLWRYDLTSDGDNLGRKQSMTETLIPRAKAKGCRVIADTKIKRLLLSGDRAHTAIAYNLSEDHQLDIRFQTVFVCAGAIQTPLLLRRSGLKRNIGNTLRMHPVVRMAALFEEDVNEDSEGVPVFQVSEFKPDLTLGGSYSSLPHLALWLAGQQGFHKSLDPWKKMAIFYSLIESQGKGIIRNIPFVDEPFVYYQLHKNDYAALGQGAYRLGKLLFAAGAKEIHSPVKDWPTIKNEEDLEILKHGLPRGADLTTIHLFASCPMGERRHCAVNSYGQLHGKQNIFINDASILPGTPGVNPQAIVMALARRNTMNMLNKSIKS